MLNVGIDYSLTCPAICVYWGTQTDPKPKDCSFHYLTKTAKLIGDFGNFHGTEYPKWDHPHERYHAIAMWAIDAMRKGRKDYTDTPTIWIENYGFNANGRITDLAEHTGVLKQHLWKMGLPYKSVSIGSVKKILTGSGTASKEEIGKVWRKEIPTGFPVGKSPSSDCIDAYGVLLAGMDSL